MGEQREDWIHGRLILVRLHQTTMRSDSSYLGVTVHRAVDLRAGGVQSHYLVDGVS